MRMRSAKRYITLKRPDGKGRLRRERARKERGSAYMGTGQSREATMYKRCMLINGQDLYQTDPVKTSMRVIVCCTKKVHLRRRRDLSRSRRLVSCTYRRVSLAVQTYWYPPDISTAEEANRTYSSLLRSEMFDNEIPQSVSQGLENGFSRSKTPPTGLGAYPAPNLTPSTPHKNLFNYASPAHLTPSLTPRSASRSERGPNLNARSDIYSLSPVKYSTQKMLLSPRKTPRAVSRVPYKVLDAPELADDFYLNLVDWGPSNVLAVGLGDSVYLWNSESGKVEQLTRFEGEQVTSVGWIQRV